MRSGSQVFEMGRRAGRDDGQAAPGDDPDSELRRPNRAQVPWSMVGAVAAGGVVGAEARYGLSVLLPHGGGAFPWATFATNASGCLLIGVLMAALAALSAPHHLLRPFLGVGVLGGYTTFSTYAVDVETLLAAKAPGLALLYLFGTVAAALAAVGVGVAGATLVLRAAENRRWRRTDTDAVKDISAAGGRS